MRLGNGDMLKVILVLCIIGVSTLFALALGGFFVVRDIARAALPARAATITLVPVSPPFPLCPGDPIEYNFGATPLRVPIVARIITTLWSVAEQQTIVEQRLGQEEVRIWTNDGQIDNSETYIIPVRDRWGRPVRPGKYELRQAVVAESTAPSTFSLTFVIDDVCS